MAMYLKITDGTTTIDLLGNDATNSFNLLAAAWAPNVAKRKRGKLSGNWAEDVVESMPLYVQSSADAATILANLDILAALLDQAQRWSDGESVAPVTIRYSPNSDSSYLETVILGPADSGGVGLPPTFSDDLYQNVVDGVRLNFKRRGLWLGAEETVSGSDTSSGNPDVVTRNFASSVTINSPVDFSIEFTTASLPTQPYADLAVVVTNDVSNIVTIEGESLTKRDASGGSVANTADADASGGSVKRFNGGNGGYYNTSVNSARQISAIISGRNNSATTAAILKLQAATISWGAYIDGPPVVVDTSTTDPRIIVMPLLSLPETIARISIDVVCASFDIDYIVLVNMDSPANTRIVTSPAAATDENGIKTWFFNRALTDCKPLVKNTNSAGTEADYPPWYGVQGTYLAGDEISIAVAGVNAGKFFLANAGGTEANFKIANVTRRPAYLVPQ